MRGVRNLTPEQEREVYAKSLLRDRLSRKALARAYGTTERAIKEAVQRQRERAREIGHFGQSEIGAAPL